MRDELTCAALENALQLRGSLAGALFHSDCGLNISAGSTGPLRAPRRRPARRPSRHLPIDNSGRRERLVIAQARTRPPLPLRHARRSSLGPIAVWIHRYYTRRLHFAHRSRPGDRVGDQLPSSGTASCISKASRWPQGPQSPGRGCRLSTSWSIASSSGPAPISQTSTAQRQAPGPQPPAPSSRLRCPIKW